jgi:cytochrome c oxidase cbb3-type subunit 1
LSRIGAPPALGISVARHAFGWLVAGCATGLAVATLLSFPRLGGLLGPFGYGRLMALHLDLTLYGWTALPMLGLLLSFFDLPAQPAHGRKMLTLWSAAVAAGAASWLSGRTSGKLFLDWKGGARWVFLAVLGVLWIMLVVTAAQRWRASSRSRGARIAVLAVLAAVPPVLGFATSPAAYPPIDPASGAPTGVSLLGSTLTLVLVLLALPRMAGLERRAGARRLGLPLGLLLAIHGLAFAALFGPDRWSDDPLEFLALASVLPWALLVPLDYRGFIWPDSTRRWGTASIAWGGLLAASGVVQFLPEPLAATRFTHWLVAHAHLAMAGFTSSAAFLLVELGVAPGPALVDRPQFFLWQSGAVLHVVALLGVGLLEIRDPATFLRGSTAVSALLALRWTAGALMLWAAVRALRLSWERT